MEELCSGTRAELRTHASVGAAAAAHGMSLEAVYGAMARGDALASGVVLAWSTYSHAKWGRWKPLTRAGALTAKGKSSPEAPAAALRPYPPPPGALPGCLPAERRTPSPDTSKHDNSDTARLRQAARGVKRGRREADGHAVDVSSEGHVRVTDGDAAATCCRAAFRVATDA